MKGHHPYIPSYSIDRAAFVAHRAKLLARAETPKPPEPRRCGRTRHHRPHPWVKHPNDAEDYSCDGRVGPRSAAQLIAERPALRTLPHAGAFLAEGAISA